MVLFVIKTAPIGVFALLTTTFAEQGLEVLRPLAGYFIIAALFREEPMSQQRIIISVLCTLSTVGVCLFAAIWPVRYGARHLWRRELPNS